MTRRKLRFAALPLLWKLLVPFVALLLIVGPVAAFLVARDVSSRAQAELDQELRDQLLTMRSRMHDQELYLLEAASFAANVEGMADALGRRDSPAAARLLESVRALKTELDLLAVVGLGPALHVSTPLDESGSADGFAEVVQKLAAGAATATGWRQRGDAWQLVIAVPICTQLPECDVAGAAVAGVDVQRLLDAAVAAASSSTPGLALYAPDGARLAGSAETPFTAPARPTADLARVNHEVAGRRLSTVFSPLELQGQRVGTLAVTLPGDGAAAFSRATAWRFATVLLLGMAATVGIGILLSRSVLRQVTALHATSRRLAEGQLEARSPVLSDDEIGELARVINHMAAELETSHGDLEARVADRTREIERLLRERTEFFASLSHELRTPIAIILSQAKMMLDAGYRRQSQTSIPAWKAVEASSEQLLDVVNAVLDVARAESGRLEMDLRDVDVHDLVDDVLPTLRALATAAEVTLTIDVGPHPLWVRADPARLREVLLNLVDNAAKYTPAGGRIVLGAVRREGAVKLSVADNGIGIPVEAHERIYEPFFRVPGSAPQREQLSTGLGLALTKRFVDAQGASLSFTSRPGAGSIFTVTFPTRDTPYPPAGVASAPVVAHQRRAPGTSTRR